MNNDQATFQIQTSLNLENPHRLTTALDLLIEYILEEYAVGMITEQDLDATRAIAGDIESEGDKGELVVYSSSGDDL